MIDPTVHHTLHKIEAEQRQRAARELYQSTQGFHLPRPERPHVSVSFAWLAVVGRALTAPVDVVTRSLLGRSSYDIRA